jgi:hypothetical protein
MKVHAASGRPLDAATANPWMSVSQPIFPTCHNDPQPTRRPARSARSPTLADVISCSVTMCSDPTTSQLRTAGPRTGSRRTAGAGWRHGGQRRRRHTGGRSRFSREALSASRLSTVSCLRDTSVGNAHYWTCQHSVCGAVEQTECHRSHRPRGPIEHPISRYGAGATTTGGITCWVIVGSGVGKAAGSTQSPLDHTPSALVQQTLGV